ncbi:dTDP-4-dehydrorhamnose 3,5-epimerase [Maribacter sp. HTCC2170]|uniref:dTDP-4-dehydrorhamnose 3,5-epimerase n=1 Tax=Maribacter sp. (strain HTCC2170 / KCCM 42371) TaxID=313603 RepID=UPI00006BD590|nr:dTDP-4-dehydrorhamnose 3,5-epimerase [Maribacter sp. HTCC2170]EAR02778.1 dTDP-4-dehydrorhamnose 3,5-epimerase [Maribacter sp. HTCC2170]
MKITPTKIKDCLLLEPNVFEDERGSFIESFKKQNLENALGFKIDFVQDNISISKKWVLRGLHFQINDYSQAKLINVVRGRVLDVVVDLRKDSATYGQHFKIELDSIDRKLLFIPKGMAHGFLSLADDTIFSYKCDAYYNQAAEGGIFYNDPDLAIDWEYPGNRFILSEKDLQLTPFKTI